MSTIETLKKAKDAIATIRLRMQPVIEKLNDNGFDKNTAQAQATVALSIGMLKYIGVRLQGKDQGREPDDPLRIELNNMKRVLAEIKKKRTLKKPDANKRENAEQAATRKENADDQKSVNKAKSSPAGKPTPSDPTDSSDSIEKSKKRKSPESSNNSKSRKKK
jgi:DNA repair photolyase